MYPGSICVLAVSEVDRFRRRRTMVSNGVARRSRCHDHRRPQRASPPEAAISLQEGSVLDFVPQAVRNRPSPFMTDCQTSPVAKQRIDTNRFFVDVLELNPKVHEDLARDGDDFVILRPCPQRPLFDPTTFLSRSLSPLGNSTGKSGDRCWHQVIAVSYDRSHSKLSEAAPHRVWNEQTIAPLSGAQLAFELRRDSVQRCYILSKTLCFSSSFGGSCSLGSCARATTTPLLVSALQAMIGVWALSDSSR